MHKRGPHVIVQLFYLELLSNIERPKTFFPILKLHFCSVFILAYCLFYTFIQWMTECCYVQPLGSLSLIMGVVSSSNSSRPGLLFIYY